MTEGPDLTAEPPTVVAAPPPFLATQQVSPQ
jgi:hypothetical protein